MMASPPLSPPHSDFSFHIDPLQHPSDPAVVPGQNDIAISAVEPSTLNAIAPAVSSTSPLSSASISPPSSLTSLSPAVRNVPLVRRFSSMESVTGGAPSDKPNTSGDDDDQSSTSSCISSVAEASGPSEIMSAPSAPISPASVVSRKLPPVPKFNADETISKPDTGSRGLMGPPPVPKFHSSSADTAARPSSHEILAAVTDRSSSAERHNEALDLGAPPGKEEKQAEVLHSHPSTLDVASSAAASAITEIVGGVAGSEGQNAAVGDEIKSNEHPQAAAAASAGTGASQPYSKPAWSSAPGQPYSLEVLKEGTLLQVEDVSKKAAYMFGRSDRCDFVLEHPTVSRYHAVLQYNAEGGSFLYDLGSTHGTFVNKAQVKGKEYVPLHVGDIVRFGHSSRLHIFQGPAELMPKEGLSKKDRLVQRIVDAAQDRAIKEASIIRGKRDSMTADGVSWGMQEDAEEEEEDNEDEITWQTFKGELTEKQQKTLEKIHKHNEKLSNLKKENDSIQAKEVPQGGLTQGQQTQVARNEQRMEQLVDEVENLEETLNDSIRESITGRSGRHRPGKRNRLDNEDTDEDISDDEFYDRAGKSLPQKRKATADVVETTESLLDKKAVIVADIEALRKELKAEQEQSVSSMSEESKVSETTTASDDPLDQYMTTLSSNILKDRSAHIEKGLNSSIKELERVERLLKIADPTNDGLRKWEQKRVVEDKQPQISTQASKLIRRILPQKEDAVEHTTSAAAAVDVNGGPSKSETQAGSQNGAGEPTDGGGDSPSKDEVTLLPGLEPPLRLGAPIAAPSEEAKPVYSKDVNEEAEKLITYKDRNKAKVGAAGVVTIPKEAAVATDRAAAELSNAKEDTSAADSVALLLRHKRGLRAEDNDDVSADVESDSGAVNLEESMTAKKSKKRKSQILPKSSQPTLTEDTPTDWVPPTGQTGDGRTALNDKYGY